MAINAQSWNQTDKEDFLHVADNLKKRIASITEPNGMFDADKRTLLAGEPVTVAFSYFVFHERLSKKSAIGLVLIVVGTLAMLI